MSCVYQVYIMHISWINDDMCIYRYRYIYIYSNNGVYLDPPSTSENSASYTHTILGLYLFCLENRKA